MVGEVDNLHLQGISILGLLIKLLHGIGKNCVEGHVGHGSHDVIPFPIKISLHRQNVVSVIDPLLHVDIVIAFGWQVLHGMHKSPL